MELAKKSYIESYLKSKVNYTDTGKLNNGSHLYTELANAKVVIFIFRSDSNYAYHSVLHPNSFNIVDEYTITLASNGTIILSNMDDAINLIGFLAFY